MHTHDFRYWFLGEKGQVELRQFVTSHTEYAGTGTVVTAQETTIHALLSGQMLTRALAGTSNHDLTLQFTEGLYDEEGRWCMATSHLQKRIRSS